ncbi:DUF3558 family protein [Nocardia sp. CDC153]|uniref:DUF3558 family protein n=1 Tax=Nocardia sp. CDC153 TaxID=3112167 RepID=UPI002DC05D10|nr:DUF3558 family protein [Nocardia sp. CDC153]MEC3958317.1 DUF3558 family protein [Nocardia sp. CDC153]
MTVVRHLVVCTIAALGVCGSVAACGSDRSPDSTPVLATTVPTAFDPCHDVASDSLDTMQLMRNPSPLDLRADPDEPGVKAQGCQYLSAVTDENSPMTLLWVEATNLTVNAYRKFHNTQQEPIELAGHGALTISDSTPSDTGPTRFSCTVLIDIPGGGIRFIGGSNRPDLCHLLENLADATVSKLPSGS